MILSSLLLGSWLAIAAPTAAHAQTTPVPTVATERLDPLTYTIVGTPPALRVTLPELKVYRNLRTGTVVPFPGRPVPPLFWYDDDGVEYMLAHGREKAPLLIGIAGTGGPADSETNRVLASAALAAGMHFLGLPSPTHPNFIVNGSTTGVPCRMTDDAADLYRVIELALAEVRSRIEVGPIYLTGYSLGAMHAAFLARLDDERRRIGFGRVLLLNPPVEVWSSLQILDGMFERNVPPDAAGRRAILDRIFAAFAEAYTREDGTSLDENFLYGAYQRLERSRATNEMLIGMAFRNSSSNLIMVSDHVSRTGYIVPPDAKLTVTTSLTHLATHASTKSFNDYIDGVFLPYFHRTEPGLTKEQVLAAASLRALEGYLRKEAKIGLITNADDIILAPGEVQWLERVFGRRATILEDGGHFGNYRRRDFLEAFGRFFHG